jgi:Transposase DNA-binding
MPPATYDLSPFGLDHFGTASLGDRRRTRSLVDLANRLQRQPQGSLPLKFRDPKALRRCYDLMNTDSVTHAAVLQAHTRHTAAEVLAQSGVVLVLHDTTELDFTGHTSLHESLGQIGNGYYYGYLCHNSLAVLPGGRGVLGLLAQHLHVRADVLRGETPAQRRERENRESLLWLWGAQAARQALADARPPDGAAGPLVVDVCDRGGDTFEFLDDADRQGRLFLVRSSQDRLIWVGHAQDGADGDGDEAEGRLHLHQHLRTLPEQGRRQITVHGRNSQPDRQATVAVAWAAVRLRPPRQQRGHFRRQELRVWALRVWEVEAPAGVEPVEWFLLTNVAVTTLAEAWERVEWYCERWVVEEYHKAQKTGCDIEAPQFTTAAALQPLIALLSVVAVGLLNLRDLSRDPQTQELPASTVMPLEQVEVLSAWRYGQRRMLTVREFFLALARLGGHQNRRKDHRPGWLVLWRGWQALQLMVVGARTAACPPAAGPEPSGTPPSPQQKPG